MSKEHSMKWRAYRGAPKDTETVFENFEEFKKLNAAFGNLTKEKVINEGIQMAMHGGAVKYFREAGLR